MATGCGRGESPKSEGPAPAVVKPAEAKPDKSQTITGREVLGRMIAAYQEASSYADAGTVHLLAEADGRKIADDTVGFSLTFARPNRIRLEAYQVKLVCDGKKLYAAIDDLPGQVLVKPAPPRLTLKSLYADRILAMVLMQGIGGPVPQISLLLGAGDEPMNALLRDAEEPVLSESGQIEGRDCYRVKIKRTPVGTATYWIDRETFVLRRVVLPTDAIRDAIGQQHPVDRVSAIAEFPGARLDAKIDPKAFEFEAPAGAEIVKFFVPPSPGQLLGKKVPELKFFDLEGKPVTPQSLAGKIAVLDFWATWCGPCRLGLPNLQKVFEKYKDHPKVAFYAVSIDEPKVANQEVVKTLEDLKVTMPVLRDTEGSAVALKFSGMIPTMFLIGSDGVVQDYVPGVDPRLAETLPKKLDRLLAGENIFEKPLKEYQDRVQQYAKALETSPEGEPAAATPIIEERELPEVKTAPRSEPSTMKLTPLWKCNDVKSPGNILVLNGKNGPARLAVVENWKSVAEIGLDGKLIALHPLKLAEGEAIGSLRSAAGADGKRYLVAFLIAQQRCHVLDEDWNLVASYPADALQNPHSGIVDVELGDLDGDGKLKLYLSYLGTVGVQAASLEGTRLWANRSISNALGIAIGGADPKGRRNLYCTSGAGSLAVLDAQGQRQGEIAIPERMLRWIIAADLRGDGQWLWCAMAAPKLGENLAIGLSLHGGELWKYPLPPGIQPQPIEPIIPGKLTRDGPGLWILPGPDGSIHVVSADGKPLDKFNSGVALQGLATVEIDGRPALVIASAKGLEAWKVE